MSHVINKLHVIYPAILMGIFAFPIPAESSDTLLEWTSFEIKKNPALGCRDQDMNHEFIRSLLDLPNLKGKDQVNEPLLDVSEESNTNWNEIDLRYFKIYLSSMGRSNEKKAGWSQQYGNQLDKLEMVKSLPGMLGDAPARETFESLGKIIEPQIKVGISF